MITSFWELGFLRLALIAGILLALICGLLSPFVVLRRLAFAADGLAHSSLGGLAVGLAVFNTGAVPTFGSYCISFVFTCIVAGAIAYFANRLQSDTAVGACYVAAFALGVLLLSTRSRGAGRLDHFFFGSILGVQSLEIILLSVLAGLVGLAMFFHWRWLGTWVFDEEIARAAGVPVTVLRYALMFFIAAVVIVAARIVGILLVSALLVLPGAIGTLVATRLWKVVLVSLAAALISAMAGIWTSNAINVPPGPAIVLTAFVLFMAGFFQRRLQDRRHFRDGKMATIESAASPPAFRSP